MSTYHPKVSFIIPCYKVELYIEECIKSIMNQTYNNIEIIPVDDGSPDNSGSILDRLAQIDNRIKVVHKENGGVSSARNVGLEVATGEYIVFVDGDDYIAVDYTDYMMGMIQEFNAEMALSINSYMVSGEKQVNNDIISCYTSEEATALLLGPRVTVGCWNKIYKKSLLDDNNLRFSTSQYYGEGLFFITTATQLTNRIAVGLRKVYYYRRNNYSSVCTKFNIDNFYNGYTSLNLIDENLRIRTPHVLAMLSWHRCQFKMGTVVRIKEANAVCEYKQYYVESLSYVRKHTWQCVFIRGISLYKKGLLIGTCISPWVMAQLDKYRRKRIERNSVN